MRASQDRHDIGSGRVVRLIRNDYRKMRGRCIHIPVPCFLLERENEDSEELWGAVSRGGQKHTHNA